MGLKFRKSVKMGPVRVNLSKSGVGYSVGGKGFRVTKKAGGGTRTTASIPGTGISYTTDSKKRKSSSAAKSSTAHAKSAGSSSGKGGCLTSILWILGVVLVIGLVCKYWKILLALALIGAAALIGYKVYRKRNPKVDDVPQIAESSAEEPAKKSAKPETEVHTYTVAGVEYYLDNLTSLMVPNYLYKYKKQELIDCCTTDQEVYTHTVEGAVLDLVPEPDNIYDPNAIKVLLNEKLVGYIAAKDCEHLLGVIAEEKIVSKTYAVSGGKYKMVAEDYDCIKDKSTYSVEYGENPYGVKIYIREKL